jgi:NitT/TauT family transport system ATP-binding protein
VEWPPDDGDRRLGYVFQNPRLLPWLTVRNNIRLVLDDPNSAADRIDELLEIMELKGFADYYPNRISVGMQRRAALARAFAVEPRLLLMDEPFVSLDLPTANLLRSLLLRVWETHRSRCLFVTHDLREATQLADRILFLSRPPARVIANAEVLIPRGQRGVEQIIEARFKDLKHEFEALYGLPAARG